MRLLFVPVRLLLLLCVLLSFYGCGSGNSALSVITGGGGGNKRSVKPEDFGAVGDGTTDDTLALLRTVQSNQDIVFTSGKTYIVSGRITLKPGQKLTGNHATLKKAPQPVSITTSTPITTGVTTQITTDQTPVGYAVGNSLVFSQGAQAQLDNQKNLSTSMSKIASIQGNVITLDSPINQTFSGTTDIHVSFASVEMKDGCSVVDLIFEGNSANWTWARWECTHEIDITGNQCIVQNCRIQNAPGEAVVLQGVGNVVRDTQMANLNGNGVHFSGSSHAVIDNVTVNGANAVIAVGHQQGCIIASNSVDDTYISNCSLTGGLTGIGGFDSPGNSNNTFINNSIYNCGMGIQAVLSATNNIISGNRIYNCGTRLTGIVVSADVNGGFQINNNVLLNCGIQIRSASVGNLSAPSGVQCVSNHIENADLWVGGLNHSKVSQNTVLAGNIRVFQQCDSLDITGNSIDNTGDTARPCIQVDANNITNLNLSQNTITGGFSGITFGATGQTNFTIVGNSITSASSFGIRGLGNTPYASATIQGNQITNNLPTAQDWQGIYLEPQQFTVGQNRITNPAGQTARYGIRVVNSRTILDGNSVFGSYTTTPIQIAPTCVGVVVQNNVTNAPIADQGTGTILINNTIVTP